MGGYSRSSNRLGNTYRGTCKLCRRVILTDHRARWVRGKVIGLVHDSCLPPDQAGTAVVDAEPIWADADSPSSCDASAEPGPS